MAAALMWLTLGEISPMTHRGASGEHSAGGSWTRGVSFELARAESWVALCVAAGAPSPTAEDWQRLGVEPAAWSTWVIVERAARSARSCSTSTERSSS
ncbi:hypothetical protein [Pseudonocardia humida]|uniref:Uncharacterized protein n=1 Tax=Pseudonocardia humida TaxID=2800819 RepID=A0ABT1A8S3_9PSEU|nr:hypothetical protein [Pseudonocardia humida]MCO1659393.1 hypothetical protein [Pseudonocardia humida]